MRTQKARASDYRAALTCRAFGPSRVVAVPLSFRSQIDGVTYKHIVLALKHNSKWGSIGLSRRRARARVSIRRPLDHATPCLLVCLVFADPDVSGSAPVSAGELYYKDLVYDSLAELFLEYKRSYERVFHTLRRVKVGLPLPHEVHAGEVICWGYATPRRDAPPTRLSSHTYICIPARSLTLTRVPAP